MHITNLNRLKQLANNNILPHAILLSDFKLATCFVNWMFCEDKNVVSNCTCSSCAIFRANNHPDYLLINLDRDQTIKIDLIREVNNFVSTVPYFSDRKIVVINNFHNINLQAANAFLKTLEEPHSSLKILFLLITNNAKTLPLTILSRIVQICDSTIKNDEFNQAISIENNEILRDLYSVWVEEQVNKFIILEKWYKLDKQQLLYSLWLIIVNIIKSSENKILVQIKNKISIELLWQLLDSLNYMNKAITLGNQINWQLFLDHFIFTKYTKENAYVRAK